MYRGQTFCITYYDKKKMNSIEQKMAGCAKRAAKTSLFAFFENEIEDCKSRLHLGTARNRERTLRSIRHFLQGRDIPITKVTAHFVTDYERWLTEKGLVRNSSSFYIRNLRAVYNKAVKCRLARPVNAFDNAYTGIDRTRKRAIDEKVIAQLLDMNLTHSKPLELARDLFVFSFCTRGMSFVDISFLRKSDVTDGRILYVRRKTGKRLSVLVEPCIASIIKRYEDMTADTPFVFPIITTVKPEDAYRQYQIALSYHNRKLKRLGDAIGEQLKLSSHTARHTWATAARRHNVPISVISESMGHSNELVTQIYLASLENSVIDDANRKVLAALNRTHA